MHTPRLRGVVRRAVRRGTARGRLSREGRTGILRAQPDRNAIVRPAVESAMSQAMSEREIEDVLNSVRRLVAQVESGSRLAPLVLTPAMRVDRDAPETAPQGEEAAGARAGMASDAPPAAATPADATADGPDAPGENAETGRPAPAAAETAGPRAEERDGGLPEPSTPQFSSQRAAGNMALGPALPTALEERALQEMVTQIVRDELHGRLGERITLAVRKLVRNEIARALDEERRR
jgi:cell pole-organizing protein PopZ